MDSLVRRPLNGTVRLCMYVRTYNVRLPLLTYLYAPAGSACCAPALFTLPAALTYLYATNITILLLERTTTSRHNCIVISITVRREE